MSARLFIALWPDEIVRAQLARWRDGWSWPKSATPVRTERLHQTLHFIGDVPHARIEDVADALALTFVPFELTFGRNVLWPHGVAVLEPDMVPTSLSDLHQALGDRLQALSLPPEQRVYRPHVTLARRANGACPSRDGPALCWPVRSYALMQSHTGANDRYEVLRLYGC